MGDLALALESTTHRATDALLDAAGVSIDATAPRELIAQGDSVPVTITVYNQGTTPVTVESVALLSQPGASPQRREIALGNVATQTIEYRTGNAPPTTAWWLRRPLRGDTFDQPLTEMITGEDRLQTSGVEARLAIAGVPVTVRTGPIVYRYADAALGEVRRPIATVPGDLRAAPTRGRVRARELRRSIARCCVNVHSAASAPRDVDVTLALPAGSRAPTRRRDTSRSRRIRRRESLFPRSAAVLAPGRDSIVATATTHGERSRSASCRSNTSTFGRSAPIGVDRQLEAVNATFANLKIGYIRGVGDNVMPMLEELGLPVTELDPVHCRRRSSSGFTTIVIGTRAYEATPCRGAGRRHAAC